jgi:hypothetical protein
MRSIEEIMGVSERELLDMTEEATKEAMWRILEASKKLGEENYEARGIFMQVVTIGLLGMVKRNADTAGGGVKQLFDKLLANMDNIEKEVDEFMGGKLH